MSSHFMLQKQLETQVEHRTGLKLLTFFLNFFLKTDIEIWVLTLNCLQPPTLIQSALLAMLSAFIDIVSVSITMLLLHMVPIYFEIFIRMACIVHVLLINYFHSSVPGWIVFHNRTGSMFFVRSTLFSAP